MLDVFEQECKEEAELNVVLNNDTDTGAQELAENIKNNVCVNHCSGKGSCVNSVCQCEQGRPLNVVYIDQNVLKIIF